MCPCPVSAQRKEMSITIRSTRMCAIRLQRSSVRNCMGDILRLYDEMEQTGKAEIKMDADEPDEPDFTVRVTPFERGGSNMVGLANIVLNDSFAVGNVSVVQGKNGMFVAMPSYKAGNKYRDVVSRLQRSFVRKSMMQCLKPTIRQRNRHCRRGRNMPHSRCRMTTGGL